MVSKITSAASSAIAAGITDQMNGAIAGSTQAAMQQALADKLEPALTKPIQVRCRFTCNGILLPCLYCRHRQSHSLAISCSGQESRSAPPQVCVSALLACLTRHGCSHQAGMHSCFMSTLLPGFERAVSEMFGQLNTAVIEGLREHAEV